MEEQMEELKRITQSKFTIEGKGKNLCCSKGIDELWDFIQENFVPKREYNSLKLALTNLQMKYLEENN